MALRLFLFAWCVCFPYSLYMIMKHNLKPGFVLKHTNATYSKSANDSTTAPRSYGFAYGLSFLAFFAKS